MLPKIILNLDAQIVLPQPLEHLIWHKDASSHVQKSKRSFICRSEVGLTSQKSSY